ncbi:hypothetical protein BZG35_05670 [Brevundimonas sp. LM2]|nr:hypothetical protein BZG35_05670 [Brevundimonas sp. LM2]
MRREAEPLDFRALLAIMRRRILLLAVVVVLVTIAAIVAALMITPTFTASASLRIDPTQRSVIENNDPTQNNLPAEAIIETEVSLITSRLVAEQVVRELRLDRDAEFYEAEGGVAGIVGGQAEKSAIDETIDAVLKKLTVERAGQTFMVNVAFTSENPRKAATIANEFVQSYLDASASLRLQSVSAQSAGLNSRLNELGREVQQADAALAQYRSATGLVSGSDGAPAVNAVDQQIIPLTSALATAESDAAAASATANAARAQVSRSGVESVSGVLTSSVIADLRRQRSEVLRDRDEITARYGPLHPDTIRVQQQLSGLDQQIQAEAQRIVSALDSDARAAQARAAALRAQLNSLRGQQSSNSRLTVEADRLAREAEAKRNIYQQLSTTAQQANQQRQLSETDSKLISAATPPASPSFPNKVLFAAMGLVVGAVLGIGAVFIAEAFDAGLRTIDDVESALGVPYLGSLPEIAAKQLVFRGRKSQPWEYVVEKPLSGFAEALRTVRGSLALLDVGRRVQVVTVTSALPNEGKTVTAVSLARVLALSGDSVLLIDCDLRQNALRDLTASANPKVGLVEVLTGEATLDEAIVRDSVERLDLLPLTKVVFTPRDLFNTEVMGKLIESVRARYDMIVIDCPPTLAVADAQALAGIADAVVLAVRWGKTPRDAARAAIGRIEQSGGIIGGVLLTRADLNARSSFSRSDPSFYYKAYKSYYVD